MNRIMAVFASISLLLVSGASVAQQNENPLVNQLVPITYYLFSDDAVLVNNQAPTVSFTSPNENQTFLVGDEIVIAANASDSDGTVAKVDLRINGADVAAE